jgi:hypothetical protein
VPKPKTPKSGPDETEAVPFKKMARQSSSKITASSEAMKFDHWVDKSLRTMFDSVADEPIPQNLVDLIHKKTQNIS